MWPTLTGLIRLWAACLAISLVSLACDRAAEPTKAESTKVGASQENPDKPSPAVRPPISNTRHRPNIVLIVGDDVGVDLVGSYARFFPRTPDPNAPDTPVLDALASEGILFRNAWTNPGCSPSRAQILTGIHSRRTGIGDIVTWRPTRRYRSVGLSHRVKLLPQVLKQGADPYHTASVGKWHLGSPDQGGGHALGPEGAWFDRWAGSRFNFNGADIGYGRWPKTFASAIAADGSDECGPPYPCTSMLDEASSCADYATVDTIDDAVHAIDKLGEPFFLYVAFNAPHSPLALPVCALPATCDSQALSNSGVPATVPEHTRAMTRTMDHQIGRLLCAIDREDTFVIFMGDNGTAGDERDGSPGAITAPFPGDHGKSTVYNGGVNVPLIIRGPGIEPRTSDALVVSTDLFATVTELAGLAGETFSPADSVSIAPYLYGRPHPAPRQTIHAERFGPNYIPVDFTTGSPPPDYRARKHLRTIRNARFKLIQRHYGGRLVDEELYDLLAGGATDPEGKPGRDDFEQNDLMRIRENWKAGGEFEKNYIALSQELAVVLPPLP